MQMEITRPFTNSCDAEARFLELTKSDDARLRAEFVDYFDTIPPSHRAEAAANFNDLFTQEASAPQARWVAYTLMDKLPVNDKKPYAEKTLDTFTTRFPNDAPQARWLAYTLLDKLPHSDMDSFAKFAMDNFTERYPNDTPQRESLGKNIAKVMSKPATASCVAQKQLRIDA